METKRLKHRRLLVRNTLWMLEQAYVTAVELGWEMDDDFKDNKNIKDLLSCIYKDKMPITLGMCRYEDVPVDDAAPDGVPDRVSGVRDNQPEGNENVQT